MPYHNGKIEQVELYVETLELLQDVIDTHGAGSPLVIVGDFNASLPQGETLHRNWYKSKPFTRQSVLLYDFLCNNDLFVCNFAFNQRLIIHIL